MTITFVETVFLVSLATQAALSIVTLALCGQHHNFVATGNWGFSLILGPELGGLTVDALPDNLDQSGYQLDLANGSVCLIVCVLLIVLIFLANGDRKRVGMVTGSRSRRRR